MSERRIVSLDFLRGVAALSVTIPHFFIFHHLADRLAETVSILGVEIFFVLSGYVLAPQIISFVVERPNIRNLGIFLMRRWMRTIPPYLIALFVMSASAHELLTPDFFRYTTYTQNLFWQSNVEDYFSVAWSLSVEEWFYLVFPPFFMVVAIVVPRKSSIIAGHLLVLSALASAEGLLGWPLSLGVYLTITIVVAALMYTGVEAPILAARPHFRDQPAILSQLQQDELSRGQ